MRGRVAIYVSMTTRLMNIFFYMKDGIKKVTAVSPAQPENLSRWINFWMTEMRCNFKTITMVQSAPDG
jgi:hypothetical protein